MTHDNDQTMISGSITDIFAHRFVLQTADGKILADLGPEGAARAMIKTGETVDLIGEMKPSELKVTRIRRNGETVEIARKPNNGKRDDQHDVDPGPALSAVRASGLTTIGEPRRKAKHFEVLGRNNSGALSEVHVEFDGHIRKTKPISPQDDKWISETQDDGTTV